MIIEKAIERIEIICRIMPIASEESLVIFHTYKACIKILKEESVSPCSRCEWGRVDLTCANNDNCKHDNSIKDLFSPVNKSSRTIQDVLEDMTIEEKKALFEKLADQILEWEFTQVKQINERPRHTLRENAPCSQEALQVIL